MVLPYAVSLVKQTIPWYKLFRGVMAFNFVNYLIALYFDDLSFVDITWSFMIPIPNVMLMYERKDNINPVINFTFAILIVWSLRVASNSTKRS